MAAMGGKRKEEHDGEGKRDMTSLLLSADEGFVGV
jgi:hypothetical protein